MSELFKWNQATEGEMPDDLVINYRWESWKEKNTQLWHPVSWVGHQYTGDSVYCLVS
jgi:hypothetical protein